LGVRCSSAPTSAPSLSGSAIISIAGASIARAIPKTEQPHRHYTGASVSLPDMATTCADVALDLGDAMRCSGRRVQGS